MGNVICSSKGLAETKTGFGNLEVKKAAVNLVLVSCTKAVAYLINSIL